MMGGFLAKRIKLAMKLALSIKEFAMEHHQLSNGQ
jgi:hypothetical protein